jgi:hypothetical protein
MVREVDAAGQPVDDVAFVSYLVWVGKTWAMRPSYTEVSR